MMTPLFDLQRIGLSCKASSADQPMIASKLGPVSLPMSHPHSFRFVKSESPFILVELVFQAE